jgi:signal transduction histidine kinase
VAAIFLAVGTFVCSNVLGIALQDLALYCIAILIVLYNLVVLSLLNRLTKRTEEVPCTAVKKIINFQISADLLILAVLLHFSGGIENPFAFYFIFHMIIASILLTLLESYLQTTLAVLLFGLMVTLEYLQIIPHYCLKGFVPYCHYDNGLYVLGLFFVFTTALYLGVYMASYIAVRLRRAEQAYKEANLLLCQKDRIKDEYVLRVTHDIKGHLATIQSCLSVVVNKLAGPLQDHQADLIGRAHLRTIKLASFVRELLKLTRMRLSNRLEMKVFSLKHTVEDAVTAVLTKAHDKSVALTCNVQPTADKVLGNQFSIEETVTNLLLNAIKYTPTGGSVGLTVNGDGDSVQVEVTDTGIGIPQEELPMVFDEFYRASNARTLERDGTGLGLSIAKHIIERHGGQIEVESIECQGTTFRFRLPRSSGVPASQIEQKRLKLVQYQTKEQNREEYKSPARSRQESAQADQLA